MDEAARYARIRDLFERVCDLPAAEREALLRAEGDPAVRARVEALLERESQPTAGAAAPVRGLLGELAGIEDLKPGDRLGAWTLRQPLGAGGMGSVFSAARSDGHFEQTAAIKLLRGVPSAAALEFLTRERQILAGLSHPNIARLIDGGATPAGQPFLVMEQVDGIPIDRWCRERALPVDPILALMEAVVQAVSFAHARLIVHCDLKPGNILVDATGRPCLLDFGIARLIEGDDVDGRGGGNAARAYTPGYASPEQESGGSIGTASDVFSLGRMLEKLLGDAALAADAELAAIVARATAADPAARYPSAEALAADLARYRAREPLAALPATLGYVGRKWLRRHWPVAAAVVIFVVTITGFTLQLEADRDRAYAAEREAVAERDRATAAEQSSRQINDFLLSMLDGADPDAGSGEVPISTLVGEALKRIDTELAGQPAVQAELYAKLGRVQVELNNPKAARATFEQALALERTLDRPLLLADLQNNRAQLLRASFDVADAEAPAREAVALLDAHAPPRSELHVDATQRLAILLSDRHRDEEAERMFQHALQLQRAIAEDSPGMAELLDYYAGHRMNLEQWPAAEDLLRRSRAMHQRVSGDDAGELNNVEMLGRVLGKEGKVDEAKQLLTDALQRRGALSGAEDGSVAFRYSEIATVLDSNGRALESLTWYQKALDIGARKLGADSVHYAVLLKNYSRGLFLAGDQVAALDAQRRALVLAGKRWGEANDGTANFQMGLGAMLLRGHPDEAAEWFAKAEASYASRQPPESPDLLRVHLALAEAAARQRDAATARRWLAAAEVGQPKPNSVQVADRALVAALIELAEGRRDAALAGLRAAEAARAAAHTAGDPRIALAELDRAELLATGSAAERQQAAVLAASIAQRIDAALVPTAPVRRHLQELIAKG